jgi:hypothetical protein
MPELYCTLHNSSLQRSLLPPALNCTENSIISSVIIACIFNSDIVSLQQHCLHCINNIYCISNHSAAGIPTKSQMQLASSLSFTTFVFDLFCTVTVHYKEYIMEKKALNATTVTQSFSHSDRNDSGNLIKGQAGIWYYCPWKFLFANLQHFLLKFRFDSRPGTSGRTTTMKQN